MECPVSGGSVACSRPTGSGLWSGFWLPRYREAAQVIGIEPDPHLLDLARDRTGTARVLHGSAEHIPLGDASVDVVHARFAYFFPHREFDPSPGLEEVRRVLTPEGALWSWTTTPRSASSPTC